MDNNKKEPLKRENIEHDAKKAYRLELLEFVICDIFITLCFVVAWFACDMNNNYGKNVVLTICMTLCMGALLYTFGNIVYLIYKYFSFKKRYRITVDRFKSLEYARTISRAGAHYHYLKFQEHGKFILKDNTTYYSWSNNAMAEKELIHSSLPEEEFYLAMVGKNIVAVYNKKLFELIED